jgi:hypothetical protein
MMSLDEFRVTISPDGRLLAKIGSDAAVSVWDVASRHSP